MTRLMRGWRTWRSLAPHHRTQWLQGWLLLPLVALSLRLFGLRQVQAVLFRRKTPDRLNLSASLSSAQLFYSAVRWSLLPVSCLARSLVLCRLLQNQGLHADLRIGVAKIDGRLAAHAWVEHGGVSLEREDASCRFVPFRSPLMPSEEQAR